MLGHSLRRDQLLGSFLAVPAASPERGSVGPERQGLFMTSCDLSLDFCPLLQPSDGATEENEQQQDNKKLKVGNVRCLPSGDNAGSPLEPGYCSLGSTSWSQHMPEHQVAVVLMLWDLVNSGRPGRPLGAPG